MRQYFLTWWIDHSLAWALHNSYTSSLINVCALSSASLAPLAAGRQEPVLRPGRKWDFTQG